MVLASRVRGCRVVAVDVGSLARGSLARGKFAWAALDLDPEAASARPQPTSPMDSGSETPIVRPADLVAQGRDPEGAAVCLAEGARLGRALAPGLECPQAVPVPDATGDGTWTALGGAREGEANRAWTASAGASSMATGLVQGAWLLARLRTLTGPLRTTSDPQTWMDGRSDLLLWEAFVSGQGKPVATPGINPHHADAAAAATTFAQRWSSRTLGRTDVSCNPHQTLNLAAVNALWAGHDIASSEIHHPLSVYVTRRESLAAAADSPRGTAP